MRRRQENRSLGNLPCVPADHAPRLDAPANSDAKRAPARRVAQIAQNRRAGDALRGTNPVEEEMRSRPISRVLSRAIIHLGPLSPAASSDLPGSPRGDGAIRCRTAASLFGLAPGGVFRAAACYHPRGALLPHLFTLTAGRETRGGIFSVALSVGSRPPGVTWHPARRSPDFPLTGCPASDRLAGSIPTIEHPARSRNQCSALACSASR